MSKALFLHLCGYASADRQTPLEQITASQLPGTAYNKRLQGCCTVSMSEVKGYLSGTSPTSPTGS